MNKIIKKVEKWPQDWEQHILNSCSLYFEDKKIDFINGTILSSYITNIYGNSPIYEIKYLTIQFDINNKEYEISVTRQNNNGITYNNDSVHSLVTFIKKDKILSKKDQSLTLHFNIDTEFYVIYPVSSFFSDNGYECATKIEEAITNDYNNRNNKDNGEDDDGDNPIEPFIPTNSNNLEPLLN